jgi:phage baseplate assembly protein W
MAARAFSVEDGVQSTSTLVAKRDKEFSDIDLTFAKRPTGDVYKKESLAAVKQSVKNLLLTNHNEKPFMPYFGGNLNNLLFELADDYFDTDLDEQIKLAISNYEPRAEVLAVDINHEPDRNNINCTITFRVVSVNEIVSVTTSVSRVR